jgi:hypothetical protein
VDELKLTQGSFETALRRLAKELTGKLARTRIVITTRPISVDRSLIERHLPVPQQKADLPNEEAFADAAMNRPRRLRGRRLMMRISAISRVLNPLPTSRSALLRDSERSKSRRSFSNPSAAQAPRSLRGRTFR